MTSGVIASAFVSSANRVWLWIVSATKIGAKIVVPATKKKRVCRLVMLTSPPQPMRRGDGHRG